MAEQSKTVDAALTLLAALRDGGDDATTARLARRLGLSRTATARLLATLQAHRLARRTPAGWTLGDGLLDLARHVAATRAPQPGQATRARQATHAGQAAHVSVTEAADTTVSPNGGGPCPTTDGSARSRPSATPSSELPTGASTPRR
jgi:DNA-binding IclR family transcriptional regulator